MKIVAIRLYKNASLRSLWMGPGQDPYAIEILTDDGLTGCAGNYGGRPGILFRDRKALQPFSPRRSASDVFARFHISRLRFQ